ncbi:putative branched-chain alpha-keto acid dehydrogenase E1-alpha subunit [Dioszegia hungarica]|uniref:2-oxoisovalerate dehydrogenase subunit alpha n=1 Tax=Dioszegia hungarica TaxID=4972 RepID=A0AA38H1T1_9TREE|nr:putative branched-chain alpha-keto acid dehydrogenase E1-alpha subunit [Dioszegia hungarica]KAI9633062.1 putative branched-chain alpha-keto acid dehydrogenase E1-alpha subunit [Dioszegia hungarica]
MISRAAASRLATSTLRSALPRTSISSTIRRGLITGPPAKTPRSRSRSETPTSAPLPSPTPLPEFAIPSYSPYPPTDGSVPDADGKPLYVSGSAAERQAKLSRMSSPLRRGTYESWWTGEMGWFNAVSKTIPTYRVLDEEGIPVKNAKVPDLDKAEALKMYHTMALMPIVDNILYQSQRQGRISFYMQCSGEEATVVGSAAALREGDEIFGQYRESGALLYRGFTLKSLMAQCFGNVEDVGTKGRQMPIHYSAPELGFHTITSPLATQMPQAAGAAYALKLDKDRQGDCVICYFGDGAASEGDFHAALGMNSVLGGPVVWLCRNNGFAISTPIIDQYAGDGIASRGPAYGLDTIRVDGNDTVAVLATVREARRRAVEGKKGVLVECMTYRVGHHSTSDDSYKYRAVEEVQEWNVVDNPLHRFRAYLVSKGWWTEADEKALLAKHKKDVMHAFARAEKLPKPKLGEMFTDVWAVKKGEQVPAVISEQRAELGRLLKKYGEAWKPWKEGLKKFAEQGEDVMDTDGRGA